MHRSVHGDTRPERHQTFGEELANSITHGVGFFASLAAIPVLALAASRHGDTLRLIGGVTFAISAAILFGASSLYHALPASTAKRVFRVLDHAGIYVLIAGTYTPFTIGVMRGGWGWALFGVVWGMAVAGIVAKSTIGMRFARASTVLYLMLGWLAIIAIPPALEAFTWHQIAWIAAGGLFYTVGVPFYAWKNRRYMHAVWHVFVLGGAICHFVAVLSAMDARGA